MFYQAKTQTWCWRGSLQLWKVITMTVIYYVHEIKSRITLRKLIQQLLPTDCPTQRFAGWCRIVLLKKSSQVNTFILSDTASTWSYSLSVSQRNRAFLVAISSTSFSCQLRAPHLSSCPPAFITPPPPLILLSVYDFLPHVQLPRIPFLLPLHPALYNSPSAATTTSTTPQTPTPPRPGSCVPPLWWGLMALYERWNWQHLRGRMRMIHLP